MLPVKLVNALLKITKGLKESGKPVLGLIEAQDGVITVTDGHRLINIEDPDCGNGYYSHDAVTKATKLAALDKMKEMNISSAEQSVPDWNYPHWERLIPSLDDCRKVAFNAEYLKQMCELAIASGSTTIEFHVPPEVPDHGQVTKPVMCFWKVGEAVSRGLMMPVLQKYGFLQWKNTLSTGKPAPIKREKVTA